MITKRIAVNKINSRRSVSLGFTFSFLGKSSCSNEQSLICAVNMK